MATSWFRSLSANTFYFIFSPVNSPLLFVKVRLTSFDIFSLSSLSRPLNTVALQQRFITPLISLLSVQNAVDLVFALHIFSALPRVWGLIKKLKHGNFLAVSFRVRVNWDWGKKAYTAMIWWNQETCKNIYIFNQNSGPSVNSAIKSWNTLI